LHRDLPEDWQLSGSDAVNERALRLNDNGENRVITVEPRVTLATLCVITAD
jgi:hypothetical protein